MTSNELEVVNRLFEEMNLDSSRQVGKVFGGHSVDRVVPSGARHQLRPSWKRRKNIVVSIDNSLDQGLSWNHVAWPSFGEEDVFQRG